MDIQLHGFPLLSFTICLYCPLHSAGLLDYILCPYIAVVDKFQLVGQHPLVRVMKFIGKRFALTPPTVSFMSCLSYLDGFRDVREVAVQLLFCGLSLLSLSPSLSLSTHTHTHTHTYRYIYSIAYGYTDKTTFHKMFFFLAKDPGRVFVT